MDSMYEILMSLPLLKGASHEKISEIAGMAKFHFLKYADGETIINAGEPCTHIKFIINGSARIEISNSDARFRTLSTLTGPEVIAPDFLFGPHTIYPCTATAIGPTGILQISKADFTKILSMDQVFLFNYLNTLSASAQKSIDGILSLTTGDLRERIAFWIIAMTQTRATDIVLQCRSRDLYSVFGVQRSSFLATMDRMTQERILTYTTTEIRILSRPKLLEVLHSSE